MDLFEDKKMDWFALVAFSNTPLEEVVIIDCCEKFKKLISISTVGSGDWIEWDEHYAGKVVYMGGTCYLSCDDGDYDVTLAIEHSEIQDQVVF